MALAAVAAGEHVYGEESVLAAADSGAARTVRTTCERPEPVTAPVDPALPDSPPG